MLEVIFISHANPEDNQFAAWLAAKLTVVGYNVWCDTTSLPGGTPDFWGEIERTIRTKLAKFVFVISKHSIAKPGPIRELALADGLRTSDPEFILPVRIDATDFRTELPAALITRVAFDFSSGWQQGLTKFLNKLRSDKVPIAKRADSSRAMQLWSARLGGIPSLTLKKPERYRTNWYRVFLPASMFVYESLPAGTEAVYPTGKAGRYILAFAPQSDYTMDKLPGNLFGEMPSEPTVYTTSLLFEEQGWPAERVLVATRTECRKALVELLSVSFEKLMIGKGFVRYDLSGRIKSWFKPEDIRLSTKAFGRRSRVLSGAYGEYRWHYAISADPFLFPFPAYAIASHVIFTQGGTV